MAKIKLPIRVEKVIPHKAPMSLLDTVIGHNSQSTLCTVRITPKTLFLEEGCVDASIGLEYMAQTVGAHAGMVERQTGHAPKIGFWVGTRRADFFTDGFRLGQLLHVAARHVWGEGDIFSFDCTITDAKDGRRLAKAQFTVYQPPDVAYLLKEEKQ